VIKVLLEEDERWAHFVIAFTSIVVDWNKTRADRFGEAF